MNRPMLIALLTAGFAHAAAASDDPSLSRWSVMAGGFWPDVNTTARADGTGGHVGTKVDFESDLGLSDRKAMFTGGLAFRAWNRHYFDFLYFNLARSGERPLQIDIDWKDQHLTRDTTVHSVFDTKVLRFSYGYAFINDDHQRLLGQFGVHYTKVTAGIGAGTENFRQVETDTNVPLPVIGLAYDYAFTPQWSMSLRGQIFRLTYDAYKGALDNLSANVQYSFNPRVAVFLGYNYYGIKVDVSKTYWHGSFQFDYYGPWLGVVAGFGKPPQ